MLRIKMMLASVLLMLIGILTSCENEQDSKVAISDQAILEQKIEEIEKEIKENPERLTPELKQRLQSLTETKIAFNGIVLNKEGKGLPGVNILLGNQRVGVTDYDGNFSLKAVEGQNITFSYLELPQKDVEVIKTKKYKIIL
ncbi:hypothetical protein [Galbibacter sp. PAP.153]|uniref:hypothetical protein n=1 Tax=Galbibacter sp. PAP.153 TaxID=3104623 RepID=UPI00300A7B6E